MWPRNASLESSKTTFNRCISHKRLELRWYSFVQVRKITRPYQIWAGPKLALLNNFRQLLVSFILSSSKAGFWSKVAQSDESTSPLSYTSYYWARNVNTWIPESSKPTCTNWFCWLLSWLLPKLTMSSNWATQTLIVNWNHWTPLWSCSTLPGNVKN